MDNIDDGRMCGNPSDDIKTDDSQGQMRMVIITPSPTRTSGDMLRHMIKVAFVCLSSGDMLRHMIKVAFVC